MSFGGYEIQLNWSQTFKIEAFEKPKVWCLINHQGNEGTFEEALFAVRGILKETDLLPLKQTPIGSPAQYKYLRQSVTLTGLDSPVFEKAAQATQEIYGLFDREFEDGTLATWSLNELDDNRGPDLITSNCYFTPVVDAGGAKNTPFKSGVDPHGVLAHMMGSGSGTTSFVHTEESQVQYYSSYVKLQGKQEFEECGPQHFCIGDLVEIQVSFMAVPLKKDWTNQDRRKMVMVL
ncbi:hypothetical protein L208DRAFT_1260947 [Tricholoma matsutake]|nr:hypothetical protein L208DRAFT_1260947 [Tricholoma matsutake 945]